MLADVLQRPLHLSPKPEVGARGAALAAMDAAGIAHDKDAWAQSPGIVEPRRETAAIYQAGYDRYLDTVASARALWEKSRLREQA